MSGLRPIAAAASSAIAQPRSLAGRRLWPGVIGLIGVMLTLASAWLFRQREDAVAVRLFRLNAEKRFESVKNILNDKLTALTTLAAFFRSSQLVERDEFDEFGQSLLSGIPGIEMLAWGVRVSGDQREAFEQAVARELGLAGFQILEGHELHPASTGRDFYAPLVYLVCGSGDCPRGWDTFSFEPTRALLECMAARGRLTAELVPPSGPLLAGSARDGKSIPIAAAAPTGLKLALPGDQRAEVVAFVLGVFSSAEILDSALRVFEPVGVNVWLAADSIQGELRIAAFWPSPLSAADERVTNAQRLPDDELQFRRQFSAGGRDWVVVCCPIKGYFGLHRTWRPWNLLVGGLILSGLLTGFLLVWGRQTEQIEQWAHRRAAELETVSNAALDAVVIMDPDGRVAHWNPAAERMFGYRREEILGRMVHEVLVPESRRAEALEGVRCFSRTGQGAVVGRVVEMEAVCCNGRPLPIELSIAALKQHDGWWAVAVVRDITRRKQAEQALRRERTFLRQLLDLHERERQLIAFEIHDGPAQHLAAALMKAQALTAEAAENPPLAQQGRELAALIKESLEEVRRVIVGLKPPLLDEVGPAAAIESFFEQCGRLYRGRIEFRDRSAGERFAAPIETALFRIVQEAVNNAIRHSESPRIEVDFGRSEGNVEVVVRDFGKGFATEPSAAGRYGLRSIRERARLLGGSAEILSKPGEGTIVRVRFPEEIADRSKQSSESDEDDAPENNGSSAEEPK